MTVSEGRLRDPVLVIGGYGYGNVGDEAILRGLLTRLAGHSVTVVSRSPTETSVLHGVRSIGIEQATAALRRHRSVVIGGGGLFGRDMGRIGRMLPAFGLLAVGLGKTVVIDGVDVELPASPSGRVLLPALMKAAHSVGVRDRASARVVSDWGVTPVLRPDLSTWMAPASPASGRQLLARTGLDLQKPIVGLALTAVNERLAQPMLLAVMRSMDALPDVQFCFIPMGRHPSVPTHDDSRLGAHLASLRPSLHQLDGQLAPDVVLAAFSHLSSVVAMRYHAMLFAERAGIPLIPVPYAEKTKRWLVEHERSAVRADAADLSNALRQALAETERVERSFIRAAS
ncbi:MAG TPA: polysaccharide pyruvyl transferase family protein [Candidatus Limnocylindria bacterium]|nr:polysaccharide pyruvyl transferase family protein [Candidatus Limnocylindria bacterium]